MDDLGQLENFISPLGFEAPEISEIQDFHESTKLHKYDRLLGERIGNYLTTPRAIEETANNFKHYSRPTRLQLPKAPKIDKAFGDVLADRHSNRLFNGSSINQEQLSAILQSVYASRERKSKLPGKELSLRYRPYPSGGGLNPTELYVATINVEGIKPGVSHYDARQNTLTPLTGLPPSTEFGNMMSDEDRMILNSAVVFFISIVPERTVVKYGFRGYRFAIMEAGMVPLILDLSATSIGLRTVHWGGVVDDAANQWLGLDGASESITSCLIVGGAVGS